MLTRNGLTLTELSEILNCLALATAVLASLRYLLAEATTPVVWFSYPVPNKGRLFVATLKDRECIPCRGDMPAVSEEERNALLSQLNGWQVVNNHHLHKMLLFDDFAGALARVNQIGAVAESQGHHPDLTLAWGKVGVDIWTHAIDGLTESDFVLAAKIDALE